MADARHIAAEGDVVAEVLAAIAAGRPEDVRLLLHPYLHWTTASGEAVRGRSKVLALLRDGGAMTDDPASADIEMRDGQIYRWIPRRPET